jgi:arylsulfatase A-like enzyme
MRLLLLFAFLAAPLSAAPPNIVVIVADDMGWADVGYHGSPIPTPHIDALCETGIELDRFYVAPMCTPTRAALLTGRYWSRFGNTRPSNTRVLPWGTPTLASTLKAAGYQTAISGKWHLGSKLEWGPQKFGFDHSYGSLAGGVTPWTHLYKRGPYTKTWYRDDQFIEEKGHVTDLITEEAVRRIHEKPDDQPLFLYVPYTAPHTPFDESDEYLKRVAHIPADRRQYAASCTHMDEGVGRIIQALEKTDQRDNTLVVFFSDNGGTKSDDSHNFPDTKPTTKTNGFNHPLRGWKKELYEGGIRVPACVNWPGNLAKAKLSAPLHATDWLPTILAAAGVEAPSNIKYDGQNIWPILTGKAAPSSIEDRLIYTKGIHQIDASLHYGDWKLIRSKSSPQLFHIRDDPSEENDVSKSHPEQVKELIRLMDTEASKDNDALPSS